MFFYDSNFYRLHDEWYWFRLLNGVPVPSESLAPLIGLSFETVEAISTWARRRSPTCGATDSSI